MIYWLCGQPGSGKTTLGIELIKHFQASGEKAMMIDGDKLRDITHNFDYTPLGREANLKSVQDIAKFLDDYGFHVVIAVVAPYNVHRARLKKTNDMCEIYLHTEQQRGRESYFVQNFEVPQSNCLKLDTGKMTIDECMNEILAWRKHDN